MADKNSTAYEVRSTKCCRGESVCSPSPVVKGKIRLSQLVNLEPANLERHSTAQQSVNTPRPSFVGIASNPSIPLTWYLWNSTLGGK